MKATYTIKAPVDQTIERFDFDLKEPIHLKQGDTLVVEFHAKKADLNYCSRCGVQLHPYFESQSIICSACEAYRKELG